MDTMKLKRGNTLVFNTTYTDTVTAQPVDLSTHTILAVIINDDDTTVMEADSSAPTENRFITPIDLAVGTFTVTIKDTKVLRDDTYYMYLTIVDANGIRQSSKAFKLSVVAKLI